jgi:hypothetical protein
VTIKTMIAMHAHDGLTRPTAILAREYICVESTHWGCSVRRGILFW